MRLNVQHINIRSFHRLDDWVERQILALGECRQIDEANIRLVRIENSSPAYQVSAHLVTPGPDLFAEARDHTPRAAFGKALERLREAISHRDGKRLRRVKSNLSAPAAKTRGARTI